jgi:hypothetical protein
MYTRTPAITSLFVLGGSFALTVLEDEVATDADGSDFESCTSDEGFAELDADVEGAGLSSWFLSFSRRCFKYNVRFITDSAL